MVLASNQRVAQQITLTRSVAKRGSGCRVPLHPELKAALTGLHVVEGKPQAGPVIRSERNGHTIPGSVVNWFRVACD